MHVPWWLPFGQVEEIRAEDLKSVVEKGNWTLLVDVREPMEFTASHIEGARNVPIHELPGRLEELNGDKNRPVVAICLSGHRSVPAYRLLKRAGWKNVASLHGGMVAWWRDNLPTARKNGK